MTVKSKSINLQPLYQAQSDISQSSPYAQAISQIGSSAANAIKQEQLDRKQNISSYVDKMNTELKGKAAGLLESEYNSLVNKYSSALTEANKGFGAKIFGKDVPPELMSSLNTDMLRLQQRVTRGNQFLNEFEQEKDFYLKELDKEGAPPLVLNTDLAYEAVINGVEPGVNNYTGRRYIQYDTSGDIGSYLSGMSNRYKKNIVKPDVKESVVRGSDYDTVVSKEIYGNRDRVKAFLGDTINRDPYAMAMYDEYQKRQKLTNPERVEAYGQKSKTPTVDMMLDDYSGIIEKDYISGATREDKRRLPTGGAGAKNQPGFNFREDIYKAGEDKSSTGLVVKNISINVPASQIQSVIPDIDNIVEGIGGDENLSLRIDNITEDGMVQGNIRLPERSIQSEVSEEEYGANSNKKGYYQEGTRTEKEKVKGSELSRDERKKYDIGWFSEGEIDVENPIYYKEETKKAETMTFNTPFDKVAAKIGTEHPDLERAVKQYGFDRSKQGIKKDSPAEKLSGDDMSAYEWAKNNPGDQADAIMKILKKEGKID